MKKKDWSTFQVLPPLSKHFLWPLYQMVAWYKPTGFRNLLRQVTSQRTLYQIISELDHKLSCWYHIENTVKAKAHVCARQEDKKPSAAVEPEGEPQLPERPQHPELPPAEQTDTPKVHIFLSVQPFSIYDHGVLLSNNSVFPSFIISSLIIPRTQG